MILKLSFPNLNFDFCNTCSCSCISQAYDKRNAGAVIHSHGMESCLVTMMDPLAKEFRVILNKNNISCHDCITELLF